MTTLTFNSMAKFYGSDRDDLAKHAMVQEANEAYFFHGTRVCSMLCFCPGGRDTNNDNILYFVCT